MTYVLAALLALAGADEAPFTELFADAQAAYGDVDLGRAHDGFTAAAAAAPDARRRCDALLWAGVAAGQGGRPRDAIAAFDAALAVDRDARLPVPVSPKVEALFARSRASLTAPVAAERAPGADSPAQESLSPSPSSPAPTEHSSVLPPPTEDSSVLPPPTEHGSVLPPQLWAAGGGIGAVALVVAAAAALDAARAFDSRTSQLAAQEGLDAVNVKLTVAATATAIAAAAAIAGTGIYVADAPEAP
jgi:hypothetical protein